jgi:hypothetical protein
MNRSMGEVLAAHELPRSAWQRHGWARIVDDFLSRLEASGWCHEPEITIECGVATLDITWSRAVDDQLREAADALEERSTTTCEFCGFYGTARSVDGWDVVVCRTCPGDGAPPHPMIIARRYRQLGLIGGLAEAMATSLEGTLGHIGRGSDFLDAIWYTDHDPAVVEAAERLLDAATPHRWSDFARAVTAFRGHP